MDSSRPSFVVPNSNTLAVSCVGCSRPFCFVLPWIIPSVFRRAFLSVTHSCQGCVCRLLLPCPLLYRFACCCIYLSSCFCVDYHHHLVSWGLHNSIPLVVVVSVLSSSNLAAAKVFSLVVVSSSSRLAAAQCQQYVSSPRTQVGLLRHFCQHVFGFLKQVLLFFHV